MEIKFHEFEKYGAFEEVHAPWFAKMCEIEAKGWYIRCAEIIGERDFDSKEFVWKGYIRWATVASDQIQIRQEGGRLPLGSL
jgi:hypothetical protein